jgi:uncharacterized membrane protein (UPF0127 family)
MTRRSGSRERATILVLLALAGLALGLACAPEAAEPEAPTATIREAVVELEIARTPSEQALGLGNRNALAWNSGMLFLYDPPGFPSFWMKRMRFDIDIVWIRDGRIVGIADFVPYPREDPNNPVTVPAPELVDAVLEVPAGYARAHSWRRGDRVELSGL